MPREIAAEFRHLLLLWGMIAIAIAVGLTLFTVSPVTVDLPASASNAWLIVAAAGLGGGALVRIGWMRCGMALSALALLACLGAIGSMISLPIATFSSGYVDGALAGADAALGLDWQAYMELFLAHPAIRNTAKVGYYLFVPMSFLLAMAMALIGHGRRVLVYITASALAIFTALAALLFGPAAGPFVHFGIDLGLIARTNPNTLLTREVIELARSGQMVLPIQMTEGLISIPSIHTTGALLIVWLGWREPLICAALVPFSAAMLIGTPVYGSHYFIDIIVGALTAGIALHLALRIERWSARERRFVQAAHPVSVALT